MTAMVTFENGKLGLSRIVQNLAEALNPIGTVGRVVVSIAACAVEVQKIRVDELRARQAFAIMDVALQQRQRNVVRFFDSQLRVAQSQHLTLQLLDRGHEAWIRMSQDPRLSEDARLISQQSALFCAARAVDLQIAAGDRLVVLAETLNLAQVPGFIGELPAAIRSWRQLEA